MNKVRVSCPGKGCGGILCNLFGRAGTVPTVDDIRPGAGVSIEWFEGKVTLRCNKRTRRGRCKGNVAWGPEMIARAFEAGLLAEQELGRKVAVPAEMVTRKTTTTDGRD